MKPLRLLLLALFLSASCARATTMIFPVEAINDLWTLGADDFKQRYSGINVTGIGPSDEGWYVRYRHENLTMLFGPLADREEARKKKWEMEAVRDAAIRNRATLSTSQVDYVRFTYSGVYGKRGDGAGGGTEGLERISADGRSGPDGDLDGDGIANSKDDDMDGDGIANEKDGDADGDGVPNGADDYAFGSDPAKTDGAGGLAQNGTGKDGKDGKSGGKDGQGGADGDKLAGTEGSQDGTGNQKGSRSGNRGSQAGQSGQSGDGSSGDESSMGQQGNQRNRQVASNQRGSRAGQSGSSSSSGQSSSQGSQSQSSGGGSSSSSGSGQPGGTPSPAGGSSGGSGNPLTLIGALLKLILGI